MSLLINTVTMKQNSEIIFTIIFFLLLNTAYFWEGKLGFFSLVSFLILGLYWLFLVFLLFSHLLSAWKEKLLTQKRIFTIVLLVFVLTTSFLFPQGLIPFYKLESDNSLLIAQQEGVANCRTTLNLTTNGRFIKRNLCFGLSETTGDYRVAGDTIYFENVSNGRDQADFYDFAVIERDTTHNTTRSSLILFHKDSDQLGYPMTIEKDKLSKMFE